MKRRRNWSRLLSKYGTGKSEGECFSLSERLSRSDSSSQKCIDIKLPKWAKAPCYNTLLCTWMMQQMVWTCQREIWFVSCTDVICYYLLRSFCCYIYYLFFSSPLFNYWDLPYSLPQNTQTNLLWSGKSLVNFFLIIYLWKCCVKENNHSWNLRPFLLSPL